MTYAQKLLQEFMQTIVNRLIVINIDVTWNEKKETKAQLKQA